MKNIKQMIHRNTNRWIASLLHRGHATICRWEDRRSKVKRLAHILHPHICGGSGVPHTRARLPMPDFSISPFTTSSVSGWSQVACLTRSLHRRTVPYLMSRTWALSRRLCISCLPQQLLHKLKCSCHSPLPVPTMREKIDGCLNPCGLKRNRIEFSLARWYPCVAVEIL